MVTATKEVSDAALATLLGTTRQNVHQMKQTASGCALLSERLGLLSAAFGAAVVESELDMVMTLDKPDVDEELVTIREAAVRFADRGPGLDTVIERIRKWTIRGNLTYETRKGRGPTGEVKLVRLADVEALFENPPKEGAAGRRSA
jgi:hypothetical protein